MTIGCNIWMICLKLIGFFYDPSHVLQLSEFVWSLRFSVWVVFINFLLIDDTDRFKISNDQKRLFLAVSLYPFSFLRTLPLSWRKNKQKVKYKLYTNASKNNRWLLFVMSDCMICLKLNWLFYAPSWMLQL